MTTLTDDQLLRTLAQATGWTVKEAPDGAFEAKHNQFMCIWGNEDDAWDYVLTEAPDWPHSVDAAMALPWPTRDATGHYLFDIRIDPDGHADVDFYRVEDSLIRNNGDNTDAITDDWSADGDMLARALCEVFYAWATAQKERQP